VFYCPKLDLFHFELLIDFLGLFFDNKNIINLIKVTMLLELHYNMSSFIFNNTTCMLCIVLLQNNYHIIVLFIYVIQCYLL